MIRLPKKSERKAAVAHCLAGVTIALEGWERLSESSPLIGVTLISLGGLLIIHGLLLRRLHRSRLTTRFEAGVFLIEAIVFGLIAAGFFERGKKLLPWLYVGLVAIYVALALIRALRRPKAIAH